MSVDKNEKILVDNSFCLVDGLFAKLKRILSADRLSAKVQKGEKKMIERTKGKQKHERKKTRL